MINLLRCRFSTPAVRQLNRPFRARPKIILSAGLCSAGAPVFTGPGEEGGGRGGWTIVLESTSDGHFIWDVDDVLWPSVSRDGDKCSREARIRRKYDDNLCRIRFTSVRLSGRRALDSHRLLYWLFNFFLVRAASIGLNNRGCYNTSISGSGEGGRGLRRGPVVRKKMCRSYVLICSF